MLAVDVVGLRQIMTVTGPVQVGGTTLDASDVVQYLLHDQYADCPTMPRGTPPARTRWARSPVTSCASCRVSRPICAASPRRCPARWPADT